MSLLVWSATVMAHGRTGALVCAALIEHREWKSILSMLCCAFCALIVPYPSLIHCKYTVR